MRLVCVRAPKSTGNHLDLTQPQSCKRAAAAYKRYSHSLRKPQDAGTPDVWRFAELHLAPLSHTD